VTSDSASSPVDVQVLGTLPTLAEGVSETQANLDGHPSSVLLLKRGDTVRAFRNICPHAGRPLDLAPGRFIVEDGYLICAVHGACFSIPDGQCVTGPCRGQSLAEVPIALRDGHIVLAT